MQIADVASAFQIASAVATIGTFAYGVFEWLRYREIMREQNALAMYGRLLELAIQEPLLSRPDIFMARSSSRRKRIATRPTARSSLRRASSYF